LPSESPEIGGEYHFTYLLWIFSASLRVLVLSLLLPKPGMPRIPATRKAARPAADPMPPLHRLAAAATLRRRLTCGGGYTVARTASLLHIPVPIGRACILPALRRKPDDVLSPARKDFPDHHEPDECDWVAGDRRRFGKSMSLSLPRLVPAKARGSGAAMWLPGTQRRRRRGGVRPAEPHSDGFKGTGGERNDTLPRAHFWQL
jgi:hypothetical protein